MGRDRIQPGIDSRGSGNRSRKTPGATASGTCFTTSRFELYDFALRAVNKVVPFKILRAVHVDEPHADFLEIPAPYTGTWFTPASLREWSKDRATQLSADFLDDALPKGDQCYGFVHDGELAAYDWYARSATSVDPGLVLHFAPGYVYMYKGFTHDLHRGMGYAYSGRSLSWRSGNRSSLTQARAARASASVSSAPGISPFSPNSRTQARGAASVSA